MFYVMVDVWLRRGDVVELFTEVPIGMLNKLHGEFILKTTDWKNPKPLHFASDSKALPSNQWC